MLITTTRVPNNDNITLDEYSPTSKTGNKCTNNPVNYQSFKFESNRAVSNRLKMIQFDENLIDYRKLNVYHFAPIHLNPELQ